VVEPTYLNQAGRASYRAHGWWEDRTTYSLFRCSVERSPATVAVVDGTTSLTFVELSDAVDRLDLEPAFGAPHRHREIVAKRGGASSAP
jgi:non-ribosomal peptide synthetase component E (peptide arylation enzyme)